MTNLELKKMLLTCPGDSIEELIEEIFPMSEVVEVANAGHWLHAENPTDFYKEVITFLK